MAGQCWCGSERGSYMARHMCRCSNVQVKVQLDESAADILFRDTVKMYLQVRKIPGFRMQG